MLLVQHKNRKIGSHTEVQPRVQVSKFSNCALKDRIWHMIWYEIWEFEIFVNESKRLVAMYVVLTAIFIPAETWRNSWTYNGPACWANQKPALDSVIYHITTYLLISARNLLIVAIFYVRMPSTHAPLRWSDDSSTACGDGCRHTAWDSQERPHSGPYASKKAIAVPQGLPWCIWMPFSLVLRLNLIICTSVTTQTRFLPLKMLRFSVPKYWQS